MIINYESTFIMVNIVKFNVAISYFSETISFYVYSDIDIFAVMENLTLSDISTYGSLRVHHYHLDNPAHRHISNILVCISQWNHIGTG